MLAEPIVVIILRIYVNQTAMLYAWNYTVIISIIFSKKKKLGRGEDEL